MNFQLSSFLFVTTIITSNHLKLSSTFAFVNPPTRSPSSHKHGYGPTTTFRASSALAPSQRVQTQHTLPQIDDTNYQSILVNESNRPVLVDAYVSNCGPCKLIERSIRPLISKYSNKIDFVKWNAENIGNNSKEFMDKLRECKMTFRKLPTVILFVDGEPIAMRSGMGTESQLDEFLRDHLPDFENNDTESLRGML
mmetsp:Transcript_16911/g.35501  ORF Transcript_16911/g.35501 Transcript_16911/m.35501 type:complete len:196 (+) Transcript_16911:172-759(+)